ncbi:MAG: hypothetical protein IJY62_06195 [Clostridia bacterium]|nr:hypothetical protein [Clostridia bacterium]
MNRFITKIFSVFLAFFLAPFLLANARFDGESSDLKDVAKPYVGTYECEEILFGGKNETDAFEYFRLELTLNGEVKISTKDKRGHKRTAKGAYKQDKKSGKFQIYGVKYFGNKKFDFEFLNEDMYIYSKIGSRLLSMRFVRI